MLPFFRNIFARNHATSALTCLKSPSGRFPVGFIDVEWDDVEELLEQASASETEHIKLAGDDLPIVLARIYYPTDNDNAAAPRGPWIPSSHYFPGYGYFLRLPPLVSSGLTWLVASNVHIWAVEDLKLRSNLRGPIPVAIFSHGLGGIRTTYSTICCDLASRGVIVVALEHRDGSASFTLVGGSQQQGQQQKPKSMPYAVGPSGVTSPTVDWAYRAAQLKRREAEVRSTLRFLRRLNAEGDSLSSALISEPLPGILDTFKGKLDLGHIAAVGHSFGAITALSVAQRHPEVACCIAYDPWMYPLPAAGLDFSSRGTSLTVLIVRNEMFTSPENDSAIASLSALLSETCRVLHVKMLGCGHMDQSDLTSVVPPRIIRIIRPQATIHDNPHEILQANLDLTVAAFSVALPHHAFTLASDNFDWDNFVDKLAEKYEFVRFERVKL